MQLTGRGSGWADSDALTGADYNMLNRRRMPLSLHQLRMDWGGEDNRRGSQYALASSPNTMEDDVQVCAESTVDRSMDGIDAGVECLHRKTSRRWSLNRLVKASSNTSSTRSNAHETIPYSSYRGPTKRAPEVANKDSVTRVQGMYGAARLINLICVMCHEEATRWQMTRAGERSDWLLSLTTPTNDSFEGRIANAHRRYISELTPSNCTTSLRSTIITRFKIDFSLCNFYNFDRRLLKSELFIFKIFYILKNIIYKFFSSSWSSLKSYMIC